jgi:hypothetical protein
VVKIPETFVVPGWRLFLLFIVLARHSLPSDFVFFYPVVNKLCTEQLSRFQEDDTDNKHTHTTVVIIIIVPQTIFPEVTPDVTN